MATQCVRCGIVLPRDDARFCNNCGASLLVRQKEASCSSPDVGGSALKQANGDFSSSQSRSSSASDTTRPSDSGMISQSGRHRALREQIAYQPPARPARRPNNDEPPTWMNTLERGVDHQSPGPAPAFPAPQGHPIQNETGSPRELHVKVWQSQEVNEKGGDLPLAEKKPEFSGKNTSPPQVKQTFSNPSSDHDEVADVPTAHLPAEHVSSRIMPSRLDEVEQLETRPMVSQRRPAAQSLPPSADSFVEQRVRAPQEMARPVQQSVLQRPVSPLPLSQPEIQEMQAQRNTPLPSKAISPRATRFRKKSRKPLIVMLMLLSLLLVGGLAAWIVVYQPFAVPAVTNTDQPFQNSALGIALRYPQGWTAHIDAKKSSVSFYDSSRTGQVTVNEAPATGSMAQYIKNEAAQLGMTGQTNQPALTFAGASWQQVKGNLVQNGATYTAILLTTEHNNRFYSILQQAPPAAYNGEEQLVFSRVRSSFRFL